MLSLGLKSNIVVPEYLKSPPMDGKTAPSACDVVVIVGIVPLPSVGGGISPVISICGLGSMEAWSESSCILYIGMLIGVLRGGMA